jgi:hypothetical protein
VALGAPLPVALGARPCMVVPLAPLAALRQGLALPRRALAVGLPLAPPPRGKW